MKSKQLSIFSSAFLIATCYVLFGCGGGGGVDAALNGGVNLTSGVPQELLDAAAKANDDSTVSSDDSGGSGTTGGTTGSGTSGGTSGGGTSGGGTSGGGTSGGGTSGGGTSGGGTSGGGGGANDSMSGWPTTDKKWISYHVKDDSVNNMYVTTYDGSIVKRVGENGTYPSFCQDYSKMVFTRGKHVILKTSAGFETDLGTGISPIFNADGTLIVFQDRGTAGSWDIFTMGANGSNRQQLTTDPSQEAAPTFSHDGQQIVYLRLPAKGESLVPLARVMVMSTSGGSTSDIIPTDHWGLLGMFVNNDQSIMYIGGILGDSSKRYVKGVNESGMGQQVSFSGTIFTVTPDGNTVFHSTGGKGRANQTIYRTDLTAGTTVGIGTGIVNNSPLY